ncbi:phospholipase A [Fibrella sp. USSR17]
MPVNSNQLAACRILSVLLLSWLPVAGQAQDSTLFKAETRFGTLTDRWDLDPANQQKAFVITPYRPVYITAGRWTNQPNEQPMSETPGYSQIYRSDYGNYEAKFQLSLKVKVLQRIFGRGTLWVAYTQKSHWQLYNILFSRPFRETNYEPEVILNFPTNFTLFGLRTRMIGLGFNHQSNGRSLPLSRSWNRVFAQVGLERGRWAVLVRPWYRLPDADDENPAIANYVGRGDAVIMYRTGQHLFSLIGSHSLRIGKLNRGQVQFDWTFPIAGNLRGDLQILHGYGETLVDYNYRQTTIGIAVPLVEWL